MRLQITALVISHDSHGTALKVLEALKSQAYPLSSMLLIDNASRDGTPSQIQAQFPEVVLVELPENVGLSRARNIGLQAVETELVLMVDDDVYLHADALSQLVDTFQKTGAAAICPRIVYYPQNDRIQCEGAAIHFAGTLTLLHGGESPRAVREPFPAEAFIGACLLLKRETILEAGGFDDDYFFYFEDLELSYRLRASGHTIYCDPRAIVDHDRGQGTAGLSFRGEEPYPARRAFYILRHRWLTILLHYRLRTVILLAPALALYEIASILECLRRGWILLWFAAALSLLKHSPRALVRRIRWQKARRLPDRQILSGGPLPFAAGFVQNKGLAVAVHLLEAALNLNWELVKRWL